MSGRLQRAARQPVRAGRRRLARFALEHRLPWGQAARRRRLLRAATARRPDSVLVVGDPLRVLAPWSGLVPDVAGTSPHDPRVTVVSAVEAPGSLPSGRWEVVVVTEPGVDPAGRSAACWRAVAPGGRLVLLDGARGLPPPAAASRLSCAGDEAVVATRPA